MPNASKLKRNQGEARRIARATYSHPGCCICGNQYANEPVLILFSSA
jgi:hypothetical protein